MAYNFNSEIETLFNGFTVDGVAIPVVYLFYKGDATTYVTYMQTYKDQSYSAEDMIAGYVELYDFDIYSVGNYLDIIEEILEIMQGAGWTYQPSRDSADMYETDTGYFHKTLCFAKEREVIQNG
jgi:hypothetical protein